MEERKVGRAEGGDAGDGTRAIIGACIEVHRLLGPGLLESVYEECLAHELLRREIRFERQYAVALTYKGVRVERAFRVDLFVDGTIPVELKTVERLSPLHVAQLATYVRLLGVPVGLLVNWNALTLRQGLRRITAGRRSPDAP